MTAGRKSPVVLARAAVLALAFALLLPSAPAGAATITPTIATDVVADDGDCSLREAITAASTNASSGSMPDECTAGDAAPTPDTIALAGGPAYTLSLTGVGENVNATGDLDVVAGGGPLRIEGAGQGATTIDAGTIDKAIDQRSADPLTLAQLTITNGKTSASNPIEDRGGGIADNGAGLLTLDHVTVGGNESDIQGGGLFVGNVSGGAQVTDSTISDNTGSSNPAQGFGGGGIYAFGPVTLTRSTVTMNQAGESVSAGGGGISTSGDLTLIDSAVTDNFTGDPATPATTEGGDGGGIEFSSNLGATLSASGSTVASNATERSGGGIHVEGPGAVVANVDSSLITGNDAAVAGGGIATNSNATLILDSSAVTGNDVTTGPSPGRGGGIANGTAGDSSATITDSVVSGNSVTAGTSTGTYGGGLSNGSESGPNGSMLTVAGSTVSGNTIDGSLGDGGGIYNAANTSGKLTVLNSTISGNMATGGGDGGGIYDFDGPFGLIHATLAENVATAGSGDALATSNSASGTLTIRSSILSGPNPAGLCNHPSTSFTGSSNTDIGSSCGLLMADSDLDPKLGALADNGSPGAGPPGSAVPLLTHALGPGSPAIDHVASGDCVDETMTDLTVDERGLARPFGAACDAGAFEYTDSDGDGIENGVDPTPFGPPPVLTPTPTPVTPAPPSNVFTLGKLKRNKKKGIALLTVFVPGSGEVALHGKGLKTIDRTTAGGRVKLKVKPDKKGKKARRLRKRLKRKGKAKLRVRVTYQPTGGAAATQARKLKLVRKRRP